MNRKLTGCDMKCIKQNISKLLSVLGVLLLFCFHSENGTYFPMQNVKILL